MTSSRYRTPRAAQIEQRKMPRRKVAIERTAVSNDALDPIEAKVQDISIYGCCLALDAILPINEVVRLKFENGETAEASVVWQERNRMGCRFVTPIDASLFQKMTREG